MRPVQKPDPRPPRSRTRPSLVLGCLVPALAACEPPRPADLLLVNGRVYTLAWGDPAPDGTPSATAPFRDGRWHADAEAVAVVDGRIVFVGSNGDAEAYRGPLTWVKNLEGATVIPGLVDSHTHVAGLGRLLGQVDLRGAATEEEAVSRVASRAGRVEPGEWIVGYGWDEGAWANRYPTMEALSRAFPDNPVLLRGLHGFATWGNRMAFEAAGIGPGTRPPVGGSIVVDARGRPTGILLNRATELLEAALPLETPDQTAAYLHAGMVAMAEAGYVGIHDAGVDGRTMTAFEALARNDQLPVRVYAMLSARDEDLLRAWIARGPDSPAEGMLRTGAVKAYYDGALGSRGASLLAEYADRPGATGLGGEAYGFDGSLVGDAMRAGFQIAVHAIGDRGNREALDFLEGVVADDPSLRANRHRIEHAQVVHPDDVVRLARGGIIASMQPAHAVEDMAWAEDRLGSERVRGAYAWRTLRSAGARLIFNSDLTGSDHDIFYGLHAAVTRRNREGLPAGGWYPAEAVSVEEAIRAYTAWPAYAAFAEGETGILAAGRWADITVMDVDPFVTGSGAAPEDLLGGEILLTVIAGEVAFERLR